MLAAFVSIGKTNGPSTVLQDEARRQRYLELPKSSILIVNSVVHLESPIWWVANASDHGSMVRLPSEAFHPSLDGV